MNDGGSGGDGTSPPAFLLALVFLPSSLERFDLPADMPGKLVGFVGGIEGCEVVHGWGWRGGDGVCGAVELRHRGFDVGQGEALGIEKIQRLPAEFAAEMRGQHAVMDIDGFGFVFREEVAIAQEELVVLVEGAESAAGEAEIGGAGGAVGIGVIRVGDGFVDGLEDVFDVIAQDGAEEIVQIRVVPTDLRHGEAQGHAEFGHGDAVATIKAHGEAARMQDEILAVLLGVRKGPVGAWEDVHGETDVSG